MSTTGRLLANKTDWMVTHKSLLEKFVCFPTEGGNTWFPCHRSLPTRGLTRGRPRILSKMSFLPQLSIDTLVTLLSLNSPTSSMMVRIPNTCRQCWFVQSLHLSENLIVFPLTSHYTNFSINSLIFCFNLFGFLNSLHQTISVR